MGVVRLIIIQDWAIQTKPIRIQKSSTPRELCLEATRCLDIWRNSIEGPRWCK